MRLVLEGAARELLAEDYRRMVEDGLLLHEAEPFDVLLQRCGEIEDQARVRWLPAKDGQTDELPEGACS